MRRLRGRNKERTKKCVRKREREVVAKRREKEMSMEMRNQHDPRDKRR